MGPPLTKVRTNKNVRDTHLPDSSGGTSRASDIVAPCRALRPGLDFRRRFRLGGQSRVSRGVYIGWTTRIANTCINKEVLELEQRPGSMPGKVDEGKQATRAHGTKTNKLTPLC